MQLSEIRTLTRTLLSEPTAAYWSDFELNGYINEALDDFCYKTDVLEDIATYSSILSLGDYALPGKYTKIKNVEFVKGNSIYVLSPQDLYEFYQGYTRQASSPPYNYGIWEEKIRLSERPSVSAASTTLNGGITATANSLTLTDASTFPRTGRIKIDSEVIEYWNNSGNVLSPLSRGMEGTTAAVHNTAATVTFRDIWVYFFKKDDALVMDTDVPAIPSQFHNDLAFYAAYIGRHKSKDYDLATQFKNEYDKAVTDGVTYVKFKWSRQRKPK